MRAALAEARQGSVAENKTARLDRALQSAVILCQSVAPSFAAALISSFDALIGTAVAVNSCLRRQLPAASLHRDPCAFGSGLLLP